MIYNEHQQEKSNRISPEKVFSFSILVFFNGFDFFFPKCSFCLISVISLIVIGPITFKGLTERPILSSFTGRELSVLNR